MRSFTSSSDVVAMPNDKTRNLMHKKLWLALLVAACTVGGLEGATRYADSVKRHEQSRTVEQLMQALPHMQIEGREIGNQMLVHNAALFAGHPAPQSIQVAYVGTSRTKVARPAWMGEQAAVNAAGNSYNEITYGLLLQAEVARLRFPNLKRVYIESSLLLRRPARLILESDHRKYLPLLESVLSLRAGMPGAEALRAEVARASSEQPRPERMEVLQRRGEMRLSALFEEQSGSIPVTEDPLFSQLDAAGERRQAPSSALSQDQWRPDLGNENVKVQRLRDIPSWYPWDGLFDMFALWGQAHDIEIVLFQPPVRADLYRYQLDNGLPAHVADLRRVARQFGIPFIDMNLPQLGYMNDKAIFSDEDHLETCHGVILLHGAIAEGYRRFKETGVLLQMPARSAVEQRYAERLRRCR